MALESWRVTFSCWNPVRNRNIVWRYNRKNRSSASLTFFLTLKGSRSMRFVVSTHTARQTAHPCLRHNYGWKLRYGVSVHRQHDERGGWQIAQPG